MPKSEVFYQKVFWCIVVHSATVPLEFSTGIARPTAKRNRRVYNSKPDREGGTLPLTGNKTQ